MDTPLIIKRDSVELASYSRKYFGGGFEYKEIADG